MDTKTLEQALRLQNDLANRLDNARVKLSGSMPVIAETIQEKQTLLDLTLAKLDAVNKERIAAEKRWQERIDQCKASIDKLRKEIAELSP